MLARVQLKMSFVQEGTDLKDLEGMANLSVREQHAESEDVRLASKATKQELDNILLDVCSWNPNPDGKLLAPDKKKCICGMLGALAPDILCLQETIWVYENFREQLLRGESLDMNFAFARNWNIWGITGSREVAILYNPAKLEVYVVVATEVDDAWRMEVQGLCHGMGDRTVALQGMIMSSNTNIIVISAHMFGSHSGFTKDQRLDHCRCSTIC